MGQGNEKWDIVGNNILAIYGLEPRKNVENREYAEASYFFNILQNT